MVGGALSVTISSLINDISNNKYAMHYKIDGFSLNLISFGMSFFSE